MVMGKRKEKGKKKVRRRGRENEDEEGVPYPCENFPTPTPKRPLTGPKSRRGIYFRRVNNSDGRIHGFRLMKTMYFDKN